MTHYDGKTINPETDLSSKLNALISVLKKTYYETPVGQKFCGIVFVKRRVVATLVHLALSRIPDLAEIIKCASLVGHGSRKTGDLEGQTGMNFREQCEIIGHFR
jgi:ERCC4-related helicase